MRAKKHKSFCIMINYVYYTCKLRFHIFSHQQKKGSGDEVEDVGHNVRGMQFLNHVPCM